MSGSQQGWQQLPIGAIATVRLGGNYKNGPTPTPRPLIKMGNIARVSIDVAKLDYIPMSEQVSEQHRLRWGDVLFNTRNTLELVGKVSIWRDELPTAYYNSNILRLEFLSKYCGDSQYFGYALNTKRAVEGIRALATGTTSVAAVYTRDLLKLKIPVPPREEQRRIAAALSDADALIKTLGRQIAKKQAIKQGMIQQLLTGRMRLPGFSEDWSDVQAGEIGYFKGGSGFAMRYQGAASGELPFYKVSDMNNNGNGLFMRRANNYISRAQRKVMGAVVMPTGAIVFAKVGAAVFLERKRILTKPSCIDNNMAGFVLDEIKADIRFVHYALTNFPLASLVATGALPSLNGRQLRSIPLVMPPDLTEQRAIAATLGDVDAEITALQARLTKAQDIKIGMMQQLLSGRTRLPVEASS